jgi:hypothetical protein
LSEYGVWIHYITSSVNILRIPAKTDDKVAAINYDMFVELVRAEYEVSFSPMNGTSVLSS